MAVKNLVRDLVGVRRKMRREGGGHRGIFGHIYGIVVGNGLGRDRPCAYDTRATLGNRHTTSCLDSASDDEMQKYFK